MIRFAIIAPALRSHYGPLECLAMELIERGHTVTFFHKAEAEHLLRLEPVRFCAVGHSAGPAGDSRSVTHLASNLNNALDLHACAVHMARTTRMLCQELPAALRREKIEALICDQMEAAGGLVAQALNLPFVSIACALPVNREDITIPLPVLASPYERDPRSHKRYAWGARCYDWLMKPHRKVVQREAEALGLPPRDGLHSCLSPLAQISQTVLEFDFPRPNLPPWFHEVGPLRRTSKDHDHLPYTLDRSRPFIYANLGDLRGARLRLCKRIAKACMALNAQLLIAHSGGLDHRQVDALLRAGATWVTDSGDPEVLVHYADVVVTHAGLNAVLDAIVAEKPILALPFAEDQPGVAARVAYSGAGIHASPRASTKALIEHLQHLLNNPWPALEGLSDAVHGMGGTQRAADIVEAVIPDKFKLRLVSSR